MFFFLQFFCDRKCVFNHYCFDQWLGEKLLVAQKDETNKEILHYFRWKAALLWTQSPANCSGWWRERSYPTELFKVSPGTDHLLHHIWKNICIFQFISEGANHLFYHLLKEVIQNHPQNHRGKPFVQRKAWKLDWSTDSRDEQRSLGMVRQE